MNITEMRDLIGQVECDDYTFHIIEDGAGVYLQASYSEPDIITKEPAIQKTRKWRISSHAVKSEIVQTALKCVLTSHEHRVREHFRYRGKRIFGPHFDVDALWELANDKRLDYRRGATE